MATELPPLIQLIKDEVNFESSDFNENLKSLQKLAPELKRQSEWSIDNFDYRESVNEQSNSAFSVSPTSGLDPITYSGKCGDISCRIKTALNFSRTFGLYSDVIYLPDSFTELIYHSELRGFSIQKEFYTEVMVLKVLMPLIEAGIVRFTSPVQRYCEECGKKFNGQLELLTYEMLAEYVDKMDISYNKEEIKVDTGELYIPSLVRTFNVKGKGSEKSIQKQIDKHLYNIVEEEVRQHLFSMNNARELNSTLISNSRLGLGGIQSLERKNIDANSPNWEQARTIDLPWVSKLTPAEVIRLRNEASKALPEFREMLFQNISQNSGTQEESKKISDTISDLRMQAVEIQKEIDILGKSNQKHFYNLTGVLSMGLGIFATATSHPIEGLGALMTTLAYLHNPLKELEDEDTRLQSRPAYLLFKAKEILEHA